MPAKTNEQKREALELQKLELEIAHLRVKAEIEVARFDRAQATADAARVYPLTGEISSISVKYAIDTITEWFRLDPEAPIEIVINSGGGSVFAGLALFDYIQMVRGAGCPVTTTAVGMAASMAGVLLQAGSTRVMSEHSYLMVHEASTATWGKLSELRDEVELIDKLEERMLLILAERSTMSAKQIKAKCARRDWWLSAQEALKLGFCDEIR
jgi:ATP-dependent Clp endopeptidase proteolytic subunit ClpP